MMNARPQSVAYGQTDSPAGLAGWILVHPGFEHWKYGKNPKQSPTRERCAGRLHALLANQQRGVVGEDYWETRGRSLVSASAQKTSEITVPVAITVFPDEVYRPTESWARRAFPNLIYFHEAASGGHFAAWEYPELFAAELRAAFQSLRQEN